MDRRQSSGDHLWYLLFAAVVCLLIGIYLGKTMTEIYTYQKCNETNEVVYVSLLYDKPIRFVCMPERVK